MNQVVPPPAQPFFLHSGAAARFCLFHPPAGDCRGGLVYVHPFAEEMNKSRRAVANAARALAALGYGVLQIDLHGCGDSAGDFADARWEHWRTDVLDAAAWLEQRLGGKVGLFGLRLGALLALDCAAQLRPTRLLLWQPVLDGKGFLNQFFRLRVAREMLDDSGNGGGTAGLRAELAAGSSVEIAGYELAAPLALAIDGVAALSLTPPCPVDWLEVVAAPDRPLPPAAERVADAWRARQVPVRTLAVRAFPFWSTQEIDECPAIVAATTALFSGEPA